MASTNKYLSHLLQNTGITPACSEEERAAADVIARVFENHGFAPEVQEFSAKGASKVVQAALGIAVFLGAVLMGIGGALGVIGILLVFAAAVLFVLERTGRSVFSSMGHGGLSQNVIAYHKASGPLASPRNRPVVVMAHYDSPRADLLAQEPFAAYRPMLVRLLPYAMVAPAVIAVLRVLPLPGAIKVLLWVVAIVAALIPLVLAVGTIANRFVLPYTSGSVCNKSSVAAMLGVMDAVAPYEGGDEFPGDMPADEYFDQQRQIVEEARRAAEAAAAGEAAAAAAEASYPHEAERAEAVPEGAGPQDEEVSAPAESGVDYVSPSETAAVPTLPSAAEDDAFGESDAYYVEPTADAMGATTEMASPLLEAEGTVPGQEDEAPEVSDVESSVIGEGELQPADAADEVEEGPFVVNREGNIRFGADAVRALGMLPDSCSLVYEDDALLTPSASVPAAREAAVDQEESAASEEQVIDLPARDEVADEPVASDATEPQADQEAAQLPEGMVIDAPVGAAPAGDDIVELPPMGIFDDDASVFAAPLHDEATPAEDTGAGAAEAEHAASDAIDQQAGADAVEDAAAVAGQPAQEEASEDAADKAAPVASTQVFEPVASSADDPTRTMAMPAHPIETVDSLMAEISRPAPSKIPDLPSPAAPAPAPAATPSRSALFDLPDPVAGDPLASTAQGAPLASAPAQKKPMFSVVDQRQAPVAGVNAPSVPPVAPVSPAPAAPAAEEEKPRRGLGRFFGRKKKHNDSMSDWLGVDEDFDAKQSGNDIGSWDNFDGNDGGDGWKGGATASEELSEEELREAVTSLGDDELLGHDIWFVATGASEYDNAGIKAFLKSHRDKLRGVFFINLECVGAGELAMLSMEGDQRTLKGDRRIAGLVSRVSSDFHHEIGSVETPHVTTDAHAAMSMSLRSLSIAGVEGANLALSHTEDDQPYNVDPANVAYVADVVTEVIRRS